MDNASKALIMAGGTLIAVLIISLAMYVVTSLRDYNENASFLNRSSQDEAFNRYFVYSQRSNSKLKGYEVANLLRKVADVNENLEFTDRILVTYNGTNIQNISSLKAQADSIIADNTRWLSDGTYSYDYGNNGRINKLTITL